MLAVEQYLDGWPHRKFSKKRVSEDEARQNGLWWFVRPVDSFVIVGASCLWPKRGRGVTLYK